MKKALILGLLAAILTSCGTTANQAVYATSQEEVVEIGYGQEVRGKLTSSVSSVPKEKHPTTYRNIYEMIVGKCAGVSVRGNSIYIRGINSINSSTEPLFIVDDSPRDSIDDINPNDVKSIDVLKDAGATSIYGSRGANGVIIIKLK